MWGFSGGASSKGPTYQCRRNKRCVFDPWVGKIPQGRAWQPTPVFLSGESPWTVACQAPQSMGFSRQEYWSGLPCPPLGDLPNTGMEPASLKSPTLAGQFLTTGTWKALHYTVENSKLQRVSSLLLNSLPRLELVEGENISGKLFRDMTPRMRRQQSRQRVQCK